MKSPGRGRKSCVPVRSHEHLPTSGASDAPPFLPNSSSSEPSERDELRCRPGARSSAVCTINVQGTEVALRPRNRVERSSHERRIRGIIRYHYRRQFRP